MHQSGDLPYTGAPIANDVVLWTQNLLKCVPTIGGGQGKMQGKYAYELDCSNGVLGVCICSVPFNWEHIKYDIKYLCINCTLVNLLKK